MVKQTTKYTTEAGAIFDTEYEAWKDELRALMAVYADSDAIARRIVTAVDDGQPDTLDALARIITGMKESAPDWSKAPSADYYCDQCKKMHEWNETPCIPERL